MARPLKHILNGVETVNEPEDANNIELTISWQNGINERNVNVSDLVWVREEKNLIKNHIDTIGPFVGMDYKLQIETNNNNYLDLLEGILNFPKKYISTEQESVTTTVEKKQSIDWLERVADGYGFEALFQEGVIQPADFVNVPYVINYIPDGQELIILSITLYVMIKELIENIREISDAIREVINAATPNIGIPPSIDAGDVIWAALGVALRIAYAIAIVVAIIDLISQIIEQLMPPLRFHKGMRISKLFERGCQRAGLQFTSSIFTQPGYKDWVIIPKKDRKGVTIGGNGPDTKGMPTNGGPFQTFGDFVRTMKRMFNADFRIEDGVLRFERRDFWDNNAVYNIPDNFNNPELQTDNVEFNFEEAWANYIISYATDLEDKNTLDVLEGYLVQATTKVLNGPQENSLLSGLRSVDIPMTLGRRKEGLTTVEEVVKILAQVADSLTGVFGQGTNFTARVEARIGSLLLSSHFLTVPKLVQVQGDGLAVNQRDVCGAFQLWDNFHFINSYVPIEKDGILYHNQYKLFKNVPVEFCPQDYVTLSNDNIAELDGQPAKVDEVREYKPNQDDKAVIDARVKEIHTTGLGLTIIKSPVT